jgi:hypothetical protein
MYDFRQIDSPETLIGQKSDFKARRNSIVPRRKFHQRGKFIASFSTEKKQHVGLKKFTAPLDTASYSTFSAPMPKQLHVVKKRDQIEPPLRHWK